MRSILGISGPSGTAPLLKEHPRYLQFLLAVALPVVYGAITGYFLGVSEVTYLVLSILGVLGGIGSRVRPHGAGNGRNEHRPGCCSATRS